MGHCKEESVGPPWLALGGFAVWAAGRDPVAEPRSEHERDFLAAEWHEDGLLQWAPVAGVAQSIARAETLAVVAACLDPRPVSIAVDNQETVQRLWDILGGRYSGERRHPGLRANADVAQALTDVIRCKGTHAVKAAKVKAHVDPADPGGSVLAVRIFTRAMPGPKRSQLLPCVWIRGLSPSRLIIRRPSSGYGTSWGDDTRGSGGTRDFAPMPMWRRPSRT